MKKSLFIFAFSAILFTSCKDKATTAETTATSTEAKTLAAGKVETASFTIEGMSCEIMCASKIQKELTATDGVQKATVDFEKKMATVEYDAAVTTPEKLIEKVESVNGGDSYKVSNLKNSADKAMLFKEKEKEKKKSRKERKAEEKAAAEAKTESATAKPACCASKKACAEKKESL